MINDGRVRPRRLTSSRVRQPAIPVLFCFASGIVASHCSADAEIAIPFPWLVVSGLFGGQLLLLLIGRFRLHKLIEAGVLLLVLLTGFLWHQFSWSHYSGDHVQQWLTEQPQPFEVAITVASHPVYREPTRPAYASAWPAQPQTEFLGELHSFRVGSQQRTVTGKLQCKVTGDARYLQLGQTVQAYGKIRRYSPPANPATFNFARYQQQNRILGSLFCESPEALTVLGDKAYSRFLKPVEWTTGLLNRIRDQIRAVFAHTLSPASSAIASALILGERSKLSSADLEQFRLSGLMHLLSISGLHVGLMGGCCFWWGRLLNWRSSRLYLGLLIGISVMALLAELRPPVLRAWVLGVVFIAGWSSQRRIGFWQSLALSGLVVFWLNPAWLFDTGAQLSFLAMGSIAFVTQLYPTAFIDRDQNQLPEESPKMTPFWRSILTCWAGFKRWAYQGLLYSWIITLVVLPLLAWSFQRVTWAGIPATLIALPFLFLLLPCLIVLAIVGTVSLWLAEYVAVPIDLLISGFRQIAATFADIQGLGWTCIKPPLIGLFCYYGLCLLGIIFVPKVNQAKRRWFPLVIIPGAFCLLEGSALFPSIRYQHVELRLLAVGHGNACLMTTPAGNTFLFDAGSLENGQSAADAILVSLADMQRDRIDGIFISHTDSDHLNAVPFLLNRVPVKKLYLNPVGLNPAHSGMKAIMETAFRKQILCHILQPQDLLAVEPEFEIHVLQGKSKPADSAGNDNADSLVLLIETFGRRLLFPGDLTGSGQLQLIQSGIEPVDFMLAPHHGSKRDNTPAWAAAVSAHMVCVSGDDQIDEAYLQSSYGKTCPLFSTSRGALRLLLHKQGYLQVEQWQPSQRWLTVTP